MLPRASREGFSSECFLNPNEDVGGFCQFWECCRVTSDVCIIQGHAESDLNEAGKKQAQAVKFVAQL